MYKSGVPLISNQSKWHKAADVHTNICMCDEWLSG